MIVGSPFLLPTLQEHPNNGLALLYLIFSSCLEADRLRDKEEGGVCYHELRVDICDFICMLTHMNGFFIYLILSILVCG